MGTLNLLVLLSGTISLLALAALHVVSPEYAPTWRMISEYAMGKHKWLITTFFYGWGTSSILLAFVLWSKVSSSWAIFGVAMLVLSAVGEIMGGLFDVKHKLHGLSFMLGVPAVPIAALLIGYGLAGESIDASQRSLLLFSSHATWISLVLMGVAMGVMISGFQKAGIKMGPDEKPPEQVPAGVIAWAGYANRLLVACYVGWVLVTAALVS
jgi:hypothetical protein